MKRHPFKILSKLWQKNQPNSTEIVPQSSQEKLENQTIKSKAEIKEAEPQEITKVKIWISFIKKSPFLFVTLALCFLIYIVFKNPELYEFWKSELIPTNEKVTKNCKVADETNITIQISKELEQQWGCHPIDGGGIDATLMFENTLKNPNSPQLNLFVDDIYSEDAQTLTLADFYSDQLCQAENWSKNIIAYQIPDLNQLCKVHNQNQKKIQPEASFKFKNYDSHQLVYDNGERKRLDILFLYKNRQYVIRYEADVNGFSKYEKEAEEIINSLEVTQEEQEK